MRELLSVEKGYCCSRHQKKKVSLMRHREGPERRENRPVEIEILGPGELDRSCLALLSAVDEGLSEKICRDFWARSAVVNFWNQKPSDAALESTR